MRELLAELTRAIDQGRECVYCAVVETRGSTPQKAGAAMLVFPDGSQAGTLGGGCVEAEVKRRALSTLAGNGAPHPEILTFCLDDNYGWDDGLICGGRMTILADPISLLSPSSGEGVANNHPTCQRAAAAAAYYRHFHQLVEEGKGCTEAVVVAEQTEGPSPGSRFLVDGAGHIVNQLGPKPAPDHVLRHLPPLWKRPKAAVHQGIAYLPVLPRITLLIVGGGHVGQSVARLAAEVDFDIWVLDDRAAYASRERFPTAKKLIVGDIGSQLQELRNNLDASIYALIVTRGHAHDEEALFHLAPTSAGYVGMIGSKRKIKLIFEDLLARGIPQETLAKVHAPLGFDIGSQTVPEIAVSIVAELIACRNLGQRSDGPSGGLSKATP